MLKFLSFLLIVSFYDAVSMERCQEKLTEQSKFVRSLIHKLDKSQYVDDTQCMRAFKLTREAEDFINKLLPKDYGETSVGIGDDDLTVSDSSYLFCARIRCIELFAKFYRKAGSVRWVTEGDEVHRKIIEWGISSEIDSSRRN